MTTPHRGSMQWDYSMDETDNFKRYGIIILLLMYYIMLCYIINYIFVSVFYYYNFKYKNTILFSYIFISQYNILYKNQKKKILLSILNI